MSFFLFLFFLIIFLPPIKIGIMISRDNKEKRRDAVNLAAECGKVTCSNTFRICKQGKGGRRRVAKQ